MDPDKKPSTRKKEHAAILIIVVVAAIVATIFIGLNIWHVQELEEDQQTGNNVATQHTGGQYNQQP